ncbi:hypothetical protein CY34DRAFT_639537 [Suillus luteus UH-Slu-Lm8-n1]|uniref:Uncharacterized protein n=1 Tax=Suillus luteus UH-Slu-Lm8-n1 TaxID=930992 RepID=A0A0C9ZYH4_9AGAM|nr:hypothetical protein CY34DRAFT_639537 [Suillus luteus UH-Slu-Lm8-n1]
MRIGESMENVRSMMLNIFGYGPLGVVVGSVHHLVGAKPALFARRRYIASRVSPTTSRMDSRSSKRTRPFGLRRARSTASIVSGCSDTSCSCLHETALPSITYPFKVIERADK